MKRRTFLAGAIGILIGAPLATRFLLRGEPDEMHRFTSDLKKYDRLLSVPIKPVEEVSSVALSLNPSDSGEWKYVLFSPSYYPRELSRATENEPDSFLVREGDLWLGKTRNGKNLIGGGDTVSRIVTPVGSEEGTCKTVTLLCENGRLRQGKPKTGTAKPRPDTQFSRLFGLNNPQRQELKTGFRWRSDAGRVKPFTGFSTDYEVAGFAEVDGRKTVDISFYGTISRKILQPGNGQNAKTAAKEVLVKNRHHGHAWFDLESGFLVRQETEMECRMNDVAGYKATDGSNSLEVVTKSVLQLFVA